MSKILVIADRENIVPLALDRAIALARAFDAEVDIVNFCYANLQELEHRADDPDNIKNLVISHITEKSRESLKQTVPEDVKYQQSTVWEKSIHEWICTYAKEHHPLMVIKTGNRSESLMYTSTDWHLLRECPAPVMIVAKEQWNHKDIILAAVDLQTTNEEQQLLNHAILKLTCQLAQSLKLEVHVGYVANVNQVLHDLGVVDNYQVLKSAKQGLKEKIEILSEQYQIPVQNWHLKAGVAEKVLSSMTAELHATLLVLGSCGRTGLTGKIVGNTSEKILQYMKTDVVTVKTP